ncbi:hypothetical protein J6590_039706 [Homalodisca vitripennis]|nr:hypothetical protein J6590_039706 [Homalodisca vitripennis]
MLWPALRWSFSSRTGQGTELSLAGCGAAAVIGSDQLIASEESDRVTHTWQSSANAFLRCPAHCMHRQSTHLESYTRFIHAELKQLYAGMTHTWQSSANAFLRCPAHCMHRESTHLESYTSFIHAELKQLYAGMAHTWQSSANAFLRCPAHCMHRESTHLESYTISSSEYLRDIPAPPSLESPCHKATPDVTGYHFKYAEFSHGSALGRKQPQK